MSVLGRLCSNVGRRSFKVQQSQTSEFWQSRLFRTKRKTVRENSNGFSGSQPLLEEGNLPPVGFSALARPVLFGAVFSGGTFVSCAIWQYENMREAARRSRLPGWDWKGEYFGRKAGDFREELHQWWTRLPPSEKLFVPICALNCLVFAAWRIPSLQGTMLRWFTANPGSKATCLPALTSAFSHYSLFHLGANMFVLHSFIGPAVKLLGQEQFLGVYLSSAVLTSIASYAYKIGIGKMGYSLGASGAICTVLGIFGTLIPDASLQIIFLPFFTFTAATAIKGIQCIDAAGMLLGWRFFDHAAHFSGVLYGIFWCHMGSKLLWDSRGPVVNAWHEIRKETGRR